MADAPENQTHEHNSLSPEDAYRLGVHEANPNEPTIFVDPDKIRTRPFNHRNSVRNPYTEPARSLRSQMENQVEGSADALAQSEREHAEETGRDPESLGQMARNIRSYGPAALDDFDVNGEEHGIAFLPSRKYDSKEDIVNVFTEGEVDDAAVYDNETRRAILSNIPGTDQDWMRFIGNHEGAHLSTDTPDSTRLETYYEEAAADHVACQLAEERGQGDIALAFRDIRALSFQNDPTHSGSHFDPNDTLTEIHFLTSWNTRENTNDYVDDNFDWDSYAGDATTGVELLKENPEAYFEAAQKRLDDMQAEAIKNYEADPSLDNQKKLLEAQIVTDYQKNYEDAYRRRVMGQDIPERKPAQLFSQEAENSYVENMELHKQVVQIGATLKTSPYSSEFSQDEVFDGLDWGARFEGAEDKYDISSLNRNELWMELLEGEKDAIMQEFHDNPSTETLERVLALQNAMNEANYQIQRYTAYEAGEQSPEREDIDPIVLITETEAEAVIIDSIKELELEQQELAELTKFIEEHLEVIEEHDAQIMSEYSPEKAFENFDWDSYEGEATTPEELKAENPETYRVQEIAYLENLTADALALYKEDPSPENTENYVEAYILRSNRFDAINEEREAEGLSDTIAELDAYPDEVPDEVIYDYYRERKIELEQSPEVAPEVIPETAPEVAGYENGVDGTAYTAKVDAPIGGEPKVDFDNGVLLANIPVVNFFNQNSNPSPEQVTLVNATSPQETIAPIIFKTDQGNTYADNAMS
ncbi:MAG: hypothetical protein ACRBDI_05995 [Alphaproteobacteria bacterium]